MAPPLVSVIMNCYNGEKYLRQAIESVLAQTYQHWELVFWDNQSTDSSAEIFKGYSDSRLHYRYAPAHTLLYEARNLAIECAAGDLIAFLDVDDWWVPAKLEKQVPLFADDEVGLVCSNYWIESERKRKRWVALRNPAPNGWVLDDLLRSYFIGLLTLVVRRAALASLDYACDPRYHVMGDLDLAVRLSISWKLGYVHEPLGFYRLHFSNEVSKSRDRHADELSLWLREMQQVDAVRSSPAFAATRAHFTYLMAMNHILQANKDRARQLLHELPWGRTRLRLWVALLLPRFAFNLFKN